MKAKLFTTTLAIAILTGVFAPSTAEARDHHRRGYKSHNYNKKHYKSVYKHHYRPYYKPKKYKAPKHKDENFSIYITPGGGLGFHYSENSRRYGYPYYW